jgi:hypothetical protein
MGFDASGASPLARGSVSGGDGEVGLWLVAGLKCKRRCMGLPVSRNLTRTVGTGKYSSVSVDWKQWWLKSWIRDLALAAMPTSCVPTFLRPKVSNMWAAVRSTAATCPFQLDFFYRALFTNTSKYCYPWQYVLYNGNLRIICTCR